MKLKIAFPARLALAALLLSSLSTWPARADGAETWAMNCAACHGKDGKGDTKMGRRLRIVDFTDQKIQAEFTDAKAVKTIKEGVTVNGIEKMKAFGDKLSADDIKELVAHVRSFAPAK